MELNLHVYNDSSPSLTGYIVLSRSQDTIVRPQYFGMITFIIFIEAKSAIKATHGGSTVEPQLFYYGSTTIDLRYSYCSGLFFTWSNSDKSNYNFVNIILHVWN